MAQTQGWQRDKAQARRNLLKELAKFSEIKKNRLTVVFDGKPDDSFPDGASFQGVKVFYSKFGSNADERIKSFVETAKERKTLFVVTSDIELSNHVRSNGVKVIRSDEFRATMDEKFYQPKSVASPSVKPEELGSWMRYFGVDEND